MISVVVPVYNVKPYLAECLDSLLHQTYPDMEIVLVNDGSTDGSGEICESYQKRDSRIRLFITENRGLSAARNLGIEQAHGEWLMFVDSDDYVMPEFCSAPYRAAAECGADLAIFAFTEIKRSGEKKEYPMKKGAVSWQTAIECGSVAVWNKMYHRTLFQSIRYPEGRLCEDAAVTHLLVHQAKKIVMLNESLYIYRRRDGSILYQETEQLVRDDFTARLKRYDDLLSFGYPKEKIEQEILARALVFLSHIEPEETELFHRAEELASSEYANTDDLKPYQRDLLKIWKSSSSLFHNVCRMRGIKRSAEKH